MAAKEENKRPKASQYVGIATKWQNPRPILTFPIKRLKKTNELHAVEAIKETCYVGLCSLKYFTSYR